MIPQLQKEASVSAPDANTEWSSSTKVAFRFVFSYFLLYMCPRAVGSLSQSAKSETILDTIWHSVVPWFGQHVLRINGDYREVANGSGDQLYDYVLLLLIVIAAAVAAGVWSWLDRKRPNYEALYQWLRIVIRVTLAIILMSYGCNKIFRTQFLEPSLMQLIQPYGRSTPMDLLWIQMGYSRLYSFFGGMAEMVGAVLLLVPQLTTLGALVGGAVMTNVLMLNLAYDVPRKILSVHLVLMALFLLVPDMRRLFDFFVLNRQTQLSKPVYAFKDKLLSRGLTALILFIGIGTLIGHSIWSHHAATVGATRVPDIVRGVWTADELVVDGIVQPPLMTDSQRWRRFILDGTTWTSIQYMDDHHALFNSTVDTEKKSITLWPPAQPDKKDTLTYELPQPDKMVLEGELEGHQVNARLTRIPLSDPNIFRLSNRGFHWMNPYMAWNPE